MLLALNTHLLVSLRDKVIGCTLLGHTLGPLEIGIILESPFTTPDNFTLACSKLFIRVFKLAK